MFTYYYKRKLERERKGSKLRIRTTRQKHEEIKGELYLPVDVIVYFLRSGTWPFSDVRTNAPLPEITATSTQVQRLRTSIVLRLVIEL